jgi:hypothetical protein
LVGDGRRRDPAQPIANRIEARERASRRGRLNLLKLRADDRVDGVLPGDLQQVHRLRPVFRGSVGVSEQPSLRGGRQDAGFEVRRLWGLHVGITGKEE